jgi:hypothetical protein
MTTNKVNTIEMTRHIRDALYEQIKDKTLSERLAFYRDKARAVHRQLGLTTATPAPVEPQPVQFSATNDEDQHQLMP